MLNIPETKPGHCLQAKFVDGIQELGRRGLLFDICIRPSEISDAAKLVATCPETTFVIDNCGNADPHLVNGEKTLERNTMDRLSGTQLRVGKRTSQLSGPYPVPFARFLESLLGLKRDGMLKL